MKKCPNCGERYENDELNFCLTDGSFLTVVNDAAPRTVFLDPPRVTNQTRWQQPDYQPPAVWQNQTGIQNQPNRFPVRIERQDQTLPTISLILGIFALLTSCIGGIPLGAAAIISGVIALNHERNEPAKYGGRGLAMGGVITGAIGFAIMIGFIIFIILAD